MISNGNYRINIKDRTSEDKELINMHTNHSICILNNDLNYSSLDKSFHNDIIIVLDGCINKLCSEVCKEEYISGILLLSDNKKYGKYKNKYLIKCIPDDKRIPIFLIPYKEKLDFIKAPNNKYITFKYLNWDNKHPHGEIKVTIGDVSRLENFYEYQLYCRSLNTSIHKFKNAAQIAIKNNSGQDFIDSILNKFTQIEDRTRENIITIDPTNTQDYDDAFGIQVIGDNKYKLSIYISNVILWLDILNLWTSFSRRVATIYLPNCKRPMLPTILSDELCSLKENELRVAFCMDLIIENDTIVTVEYKNCLIKVSKNYKYDEEALMASKLYQNTMKCINNIINNYKYIDRVNNSHDLISYLMILMNYNVAKELIKYKTGIFRSSMIKDDEDRRGATNTPTPQHTVTDEGDEGNEGNEGDEGLLPYPHCYLSPNVSNFIKIWKNSHSSYILYADQYGHELLELEAYVHITSPIRRLVDILNMIDIQNKLNLISLSDEMSLFYNNWIEELEYINTTMRAIRRVQTDCSLLEKCTNDPLILERIYTGYLFDRIVRNDGLRQYVVFVEELKLITKLVINNEYKNYSKHTVKLYIFESEATLKKKIKIELVN